MTVVDSRALFDDRGTGDLLSDAKLRPLVHRHPLHAGPGRYMDVAPCLGRGVGLRRRPGDLERGRGLAHMHPDAREFDRVVVVDLAIERMIERLEARFPIGLRRGGVARSRDFHLERVVLARIAQIDAPAHDGGDTARHQLAGLGFELAEPGIDRGEVHRLQDPPHGAAPLERDRGGEQAERRHDARMGRDDEAGAAELAGEPGRVDGPGPAESDHRQLGRRLALLGDIDPGRRGHVLVDDLVDTRRRLEGRESGLLREMLPDRPLRRAAVEGHAAAEEVVGVEVAERQVRIRHRRRRAAQAVARGSGRRTGAVGPDPDQAETVHPGDAAASRPDLEQVIHRHCGGEAAPRLEPVHAVHLVAAGPGGPAVLDDAELRGRSPHVERQQAADPCETAEIGRRLDPGGRSRLDELDRHPLRRLDRRGAAVRQHDEEPLAIAAPGETFRQPLQIALRHRLDIGVEHGGGRAFVFLGLGVHLVRQRNGGGRKLLAEDLRRTALMGSVAV